MKTDVLPMQYDSFERRMSDADIAHSEQHIVTWPIRRGLFG
jgi:hypothetical protein